MMSFRVLFMTPQIQLTDIERLTSDYIIIIIFFFFYTSGSKGSRGLKTKVKNKAGMAIGPVDPWKTSRAKAPS